MPSVAGLDVPEQRAPIGRVGWEARCGRTDRVPPERRRAREELVQFAEHASVERVDERAEHFTDDRSSALGEPERDFVSLQDSERHGIGETRPGELRQGKLNHGRGGTNGWPEAPVLVGVSGTQPSRACFLFPCTPKERHVEGGAAEERLPSNGQSPPQWGLVKVEILGQVVKQDWPREITACDQYVAGSCRVHWIRERRKQESHDEEKDDSSHQDAEWMRLIARMLA